VIRDELSVGAVAYQHGTSLARYRVAEVTDELGTALVALVHAKVFDLRNHEVRIWSHASDESVVATLDAWHELQDVVRRNVLAVVNDVLIVTTLHVAFVAEVRGLLALTVGRIAQLPEGARLRLEVVQGAVSGFTHLLLGIVAGNTTSVTHVAVALVEIRVAERAIGAELCLRVLSSLTLKHGVSALAALEGLSPVACPSLDAPARPCARTT
jgi:hypothetical protein